MTQNYAREIEAALRKSRAEREVMIYRGGRHCFGVFINRSHPKQTVQAIQAQKQTMRWSNKHFRLSTHFEVLV